MSDISVLVIQIKQNLTLSHPVDIRAVNWEVLKSHFGAGMEKWFREEIPEFGVHTVE